MRRYLTHVTVACFAAALLLSAACKADDGASTRTVGQRAANSPAISMATPPANEPAGPVAEQPTPHPTSTPNDGVRRVTVAELQKGLEDGSAVVIDVRDQQSYQKGHIKGALSIPREEIQGRLDELPKDKLLVFYCA